MSAGVRGARGGKMGDEQQLEYRDLYLQAKKDAASKQEKVQQLSVRAQRAEEALKRLKSQVGEDGQRLQGHNAPKGAGKAVEAERRAEEAEERAREGESKLKRERERVGHWKSQAQEYKRQLNRLQRVARQPRQRSSESPTPAPEDSQARHEAEQLRKEVARLQRQLSEAQDQAAAAAFRSLSGHQKPPLEAREEPPRQTGSTEPAPTTASKAERPGNLQRLTIKGEPLECDLRTGICYEPGAEKEGTLALALGVLTRGETLARPGGRSDALERVRDATREDALGWAWAVHKAGGPHRVQEPGGLQEALLSFDPHMTEAEAAFVEAVVVRGHGAKDWSTPEEIVTAFAEAVEDVDDTDRASIDEVLRRIASNVEEEVQWDSGPLLPNRIKAVIRRCGGANLTERDERGCLQRMWQNDPLGRGLFPEEVKMALGLPVAVGRLHTAEAEAWTEWRVVDLGEMVWGGGYVDLENLQVYSSLEPMPEPAGRLEAGDIRHLGYPPALLERAGASRLREALSEELDEQGYVSRRAVAQVARQVGGLSHAQARFVADAVSLGKSLVGPVETIMEAFRRIESSWGGQLNASLSLDAAFHSLDKDGDGVLLHSEALGLLENPTEYDKQQLLGHLFRLDPRGLGRAREADLRKAAGMESPMLQRSAKRGSPWPLQDVSAHAGGGGTFKRDQESGLVVQMTMGEGEHAGPPLPLGWLLEGGDIDRDLREPGRPFLTDLDSRMHENGTSLASAFDEVVNQSSQRQRLDGEDLVALARVAGGKNISVANANYLAAMVVAGPLRTQNPMAYGQIEQALAQALEVEKEVYRDVRAAAKTLTSLKSAISSHGRVAANALFRSFDPTGRSDVPLAFADAAGALRAICSLSKADIRLVLCHLHHRFALREIHFEDIERACGLAEATSSWQHERRPGSRHSARKSGFRRMHPEEFFSVLRDEAQQHAQHRKVLRPAEIREHAKNVIGANGSDASFFVGMLCLSSEGAKWRDVKSAAEECLEASKAAGNRGRQELQEALSWVHNLLERNRDTVLSLFRRFDKDGSCYLEPDELHRLFANAVPGFSAREHRLLLAQFRLLDLDRDGSISYKELREAMAKHHDARTKAVADSVSHHHHHTATKHEVPARASQQGVAGAMAQRFAKMEDELNETKLALAREREHRVKAPASHHETEWAQRSQDGKRGGDKPPREFVDGAWQQLNELSERYDGSHRVLEGLKEQHRRTVEQLEEANEQLNEERKNNARLQAEQKRLETELETARELEPLLDQARNEKANLERENHQLLSAAMQGPNESLQELQKLRRNLSDAQRERANAELREAQLKNELERYRRSGAEFPSSAPGDAQAEGEVEKLKSENARLKLDLETEREKVQVYEATGSGKLSAQPGAAALRSSGDEDKLSDEEARKALKTARERLFVQDDEIYKLQDRLALEEEKLRDKEQELEDEREKCVAMERRLSAQAREIKQRDMQLRQLERGKAGVTPPSRHTQRRTDAKEEEVEGEDGEEEVEEEIDEGLRPGENALELEVHAVNLEREADLWDSDEGPKEVLVAVDFFEHDTQATPLGAGLRPDVAVSLQLDAKEDAFFARYLWQGTVRLELCTNPPVDGEANLATVAIAAIPLRRLAEEGARGLWGGFQTEVFFREGTQGAVVGSARVGIRLAKPMDRALVRSAEMEAAPREHGIAAEAARRALQEPHGSCSVEVEVTACEGFAFGSRPFASYKLPGHIRQDTAIGRGPDAQFEDVAQFPYHWSQGLQRELRQHEMEVYVLNDAEEEGRSGLLGVARVPLGPAIEGDVVEGAFGLGDSDASSPEERGRVRLRIRLLDALGRPIGGRRPEGQQAGLVPRSEREGDGGQEEQGGETEAEASPAARRYQGEGSVDDSVDLHELMQPYRETDRWSGDEAAGKHRATFYAGRLELTEPLPSAFTHIEANAWFLGRHLEGGGFSEEVALERGSSSAEVGAGGEMSLEESEGREVLQRFLDESPGDADMVAVEVWARGEGGAKYLGRARVTVEEIAETGSVRAWRRLVGQEGNSTGDVFLSLHISF